MVSESQKKKEEPFLFFPLPPPFLSSFLSSPPPMFILSLYFGFFLLPMCFPVSGVVAKPRLINCAETHSVKFGMLKHGRGVKNSVKRGLQSCRNWKSLGVSHLNRSSSCVFHNTREGSNTSASQHSVPRSWLTFSVQR